MNHFCLLFVPAALCFGLNILADSEDSINYEMLGIREYKKGNFVTAIADFDKAILLDKNNVELFEVRGRAKTAIGNLDEAIVDYSRAIELNPHDPILYDDLGSAKKDKGDLDGAIVCYGKAIALDSSDGVSWGDRGIAKQIKGDLDGAIYDYDQALGKGLTTQNIDYLQFYLWVVKEKKEPSAGPTAQLLAYLNSRSVDLSADWPTTIGGFLVDKMDEPNFLKAATSPYPHQESERHCEAWYFVGIKRLLKNDIKPATQAFQQCIVIDIVNEPVEHYFAKAELRKLVGK